ncbi:hypothetical protein CAOG_006357 [Capsaspora owczarzaki ATCC 30864]|uniref:ATP-dependent DNA helicase II subunit 2 n=1 Tax=Capsaspora owczarzaki (strain ATCC 30864) TaxID=595528 RepID=A0A0D2X4F7_CAPO3|nr:hypothetical protein CAOG_006357 [Capsaspora owczarzaki ATCC 30864]
MASKEITVILLDVGPTMSAPTAGGAGPSFLENAVKGIDMLVQQKVFTNRKDLISLVLIGTKDTNNELAQGGQYQNITVARPAEIPDLQLVRYLQDQIKPGKVHADFVDGLVVAIDLIIKAVATKKFDKRIMLFTDARSPYNDDGVSEIVDKLKLMECAVSVIADFDDPARKVFHAKTKQQRAGEAFLSTLAEETNGLTASFRRALEMLARFRARQVKQVTTFRGDLNIGSINIPVYNYTRTAEAKVPTFKKLSAVAQQAAEPGDMEVRRETSYFLQEDEETEVQKEDITRAYKYGKDFIPWSSVDESTMKLSSHKCLSVLGFTAASNIPRQLLMGGAVAVVPQPGDAVASKALSAFAQAMVLQKSVAIVRYVFRENANVRLGCLHPVISAEHFYLLYNSLPFAEDMREYPFTTLHQKRYMPSAEQLKVVDGLIDKLDLTMAYHDQEGNAMDALHPKLSFNPVLQRVYQCVKQRALHPDDDIPPLDPLIEKYVNPSQDIFARAQAELDRVRQAFPLQVIERKEKDEAVKLWNEADAPVLNVDPVDLLGGASHAAKKVKLENPDGNAGPVTLDSLSSGQVMEVGSIDPIKDFRTMVSSKTRDLVSTAVAQMKKRIIQLITESFGSNLFQKAFDCLKVLRIECVRSDESAQFNDFMGLLKQTTSNKHHNPQHYEFWQLIVKAKITLISSDEAYDSEVTPEQAQQFLEDAVDDSAQVAVATPKDQDVDDLMDMME